MQYRQIVGVTMLVTFAVGCSDAAERAAIADQPAGATEPGRIADTIPAAPVTAMQQNQPAGIESSGAASWSLAAIQTALQASPAHFVGVEDGDCALFGRIADAEFGSDDKLFVLDAHSRTVTVIDTLGRCTATIGRRGHGPGEFETPAKLLIAANILHVLDPGNKRIERFAISNSRVEHLPSIPLDFVATALCDSKGSLVVTGGREGLIAHIVNHDGVQASFGRFTDDADPVIAMISVPGHVMCRKASGQILVAGQIVPLIHIYTREGTRLASDSIPNFRPMELIRNGTRIVGYRPSKQGFDYTAAVHELVSGEALVQIGAPINDVETYADVTSFMVDLTSGKVQATDNDIPHVIALGRQYMAVAAHRDYPRMAIYSRR